MGECGCTSGNRCFKLKAPDGWYVIELCQGCYYCVGGPGLSIYHPGAVQYLGYGDIEEMPDLPVIGEGEHKIAMIKCGMDPDEATKAASNCFCGTEVEDNHVDGITAEILGEDFWKEYLCEAPSIVYPTKEEDEKQK